MEKVQSTRPEWAAEPTPSPEMVKELAMSWSAVSRAVEMEAPADGVAEREERVTWEVWVRSRSVKVM